MRRGSYSSIARDDVAPSSADAAAYPNALSPSSAEHYLTSEDMERMSAIWRDAVFQYLEDTQPGRGEWQLFKQNALSVDDIFPKSRMDWTLGTGVSKGSKQKIRQLLERVITYRPLMENLTEWGKSCVSHSRICY